MHISIYKEVDLHWWGDTILLGRNLDEYCILEKEEVFLVEYLCRTTDIKKLIGTIAMELETEKEFIENFINIFMQNYQKYFYYSKQDLPSQIRVSGKKGAYFPIELHVSLTNVCVQKCRHCYKSASTKGTYIDYDSLCNFLDYMKGHVPYLTLSGGEPMLHPQFLEIMERYANEFSICVLSSGYKIDATLLSTISRAKRGMVVSLYSSVPLIHDEFVGMSGSYWEIMRTLENALANDINVGITTILNSDNYDDIEQLVMKLTKMGIRYISIGRLASVGRAKDNELECNLKISDKLNVKLEQLQKIYNNVFIVGNSPKKTSELRLSPLKCSAGTLQWSVFENGEIHPCGVCATPDLMLGYIKDFDTSILFDRSSYTYRISKLAKIQKLQKSDKKCLHDIM